MNCNYVRACQPRLFETYPPLRRTKKRPAHKEPAAVLCGSCGLPAAAGTAERLALLLEAIRAVHRLVAAGHERHLSLVAARCARGGVHLARATAEAVAATIAIAAVAAAARAASLARLPAG